MDGLHVRVPALEVTYSLADRRFAAGCAESDGSAAACAVTQLELFVMAPMCVLLFAAYLKRWRCRDALELVLCTLQVGGTVAFAGPQVFIGLKDVWRGWELTLESVAYFWFAFAFCMPLWVVVPLALGARAWRRLDVALARTEAHVRDAKAE